MFKPYMVLTFLAGIFQFVTLTHANDFPQDILGIIMQDLPLASRQAISSWHHAALN
jgi:hypothetical protein